MEALDRIAEERRIEAGQGRAGELHARSASSSPVRIAPCSLSWLKEASNSDTGNAGMRQQLRSLKGQFVLGRAGMERNAAAHESSTEQDAAAHKPRRASREDESWRNLPGSRQIR